MLARAPAILATLGPVAASAQAPPTVISPDGRTRLEVDAAFGLGYRVIRYRAIVMATSPISVVTSQGSLGKSDSALASAEAGAVDVGYLPVMGKPSRVPDRYHQIGLHLTPPKDGVRYDLIARAYDDGVAFRFATPAKTRFQTIEVWWETTEEGHGAP